MEPMTQTMMEYNGLYIKLKVDKQRPYNQVVHSVIGMRCIIQILIEIPPFGPDVFIEGPAEARKRAVLIEAGLTDHLRV
jgi:hypothetical protein